MRCPICGAKLKNEKCPYCKITNKQVIYASNKQAKEIRKLKQDQSNIHYSTVLTHDINKVKLWIFLVIGGWFGADSFLTGKYTKGYFQFFSYVGIFICGLLSTLAEMYSWGVNAVDTFGALLSFASLFGVVNFLMWFIGVISLLTKKYKIPVVMPNEEIAHQMHYEYTKKQQEKYKEEQERKHK